MNQTEKNILVITISAILLVFLFIFTIFFIYQANEDPFSNNNPSDSVINTKFNSCQDMSNTIYSYLKECEENNSCQQFRSFPEVGTLQETEINSESLLNNPLPSDSSSSRQLPDNTKNSDFSATNNQILNVDEGDFVKTNGKYIFKAGQGAVSITKILPDGNMSYITSIYPEQDLGDNLKMHITQDRLVLMGNGYTNNVLVFIYDISENSISNEDIRLLKSFSMEGNLKDTRLINNNLFVITNSTFDYYSFFYNNNSSNPIFGGREISNSNLKKPLRSNELANILPKKDNANLNCSDIKIINPINNLESITTIIGIDINNSNKDIFTESILGSSENIYMSEKNLYLANSVYENNINNTEFLRFKLNNNLVVFDKKTSLVGNLINQFAMDEYKDNLRIAMTKRSTTGSVESLNNTITILDKNFNKSGEITSLARGEKIYSARFMGDKGYIVTFRETDPLFTFDLSDPKNPKTVGELKIPGFSNYLHPIKNGDYLIGVGRDTDTRGVQKGVKLSLFDVRGLQTAREVGNIIIGETSNTYSQVIKNDHKALLWDERNDMLTLPIRESIEKPSDRGYVAPPKYYQGSYFFKINQEKGFDLLGRTSHQNTPPTNTSLNSLDIKRQIYVDNYIYTISDAKINSFNINDILNRKIEIKSSMDL